MECDASLLRSVRAFATEYRATHPTLDILVLTQGMVSTSRVATSEDLDMKLSLHYFSRVTAIQQLLPALRASTDARVLSVRAWGVPVVFLPGFDTCSALARRPVCPF